MVETSDSTKVCLVLKDRNNCIGIDIRATLWLAQVQGLMKAAEGCPKAKWPLPGNIVGLMMRMAIQPICVLVFVY